MRIKPRVWAPNAKSVTMALENRLSVVSSDDLDQPPLEENATLTTLRFSCHRQPDTPGWWQSDKTLKAGDDYRFSIDGAPMRPDPRSAWQPYGVHGCSRVFNASHYAWGDEAWCGKDVRDCILYELHVGTFTREGTLNSAIEKLDHLSTLGVSMIELMPLAAFGGERGWGYDGVGLYAVHESYGGPRALQEFVDAAHQAGMAVCLDVVYNHLGPSGNYLSEFGPYFSTSHTTPWGQAMNLDGIGCEGVRAFIIDNACRWFDDFHIDALRLDAVHALIDDSSTHLLAELSTKVEALSTQLKRPLSLIAESDLNNASMVKPAHLGGRGMTAQWADDIHHALHTFTSGERHGYYSDFGSVSTLSKAFSDIFVHDGCYSSFRKKPWGKPVPRETDARRFIAFASNHDQVGNRALGDRPAATLSDFNLAFSAAMILTAPFTPMLFMGEEWGAQTPFQYFTNHQEAELAEAVRNGRAAEFGHHGWKALHGDDLVVPDPQSLQTFQDSKLDWQELSGSNHQRLLLWHRELITLRKSYALSNASMNDWILHAAKDVSWIVIERRKIVMLITFSGEPECIHDILLPKFTEHASPSLSLIGAWKSMPVPESVTHSVKLPANTIAIYARNKP